MCFNWTLVGSSPRVSFPRAHSVHEQEIQRPKCFMSVSQRSDICPIANIFWMSPSPCFFCWRQIVPRSPLRSAAPSAPLLPPSASAHTAESCFMTTKNILHLKQSVCLHMSGVNVVCLDLSPRGDISLVEEEPTPWQRPLSPESVCVFCCRLWGQPEGSDGICFGLWPSSVYELRGHADSWETHKRACTHKPLLQTLTLRSAWS